MLIRPAGLLACILVSAPLYAQTYTADDCIGEYETLKGRFNPSAGQRVDCVQDGHIIALDMEGEVNDLPLDCLAVLGDEQLRHQPGVEDHWHLTAQAVLGPNPSCTVQLLGFTGQALADYPVCGTTGEPVALPADEGARWRNYLRGECPKKGEE